MPAPGKMPPNRQQARQGLAPTPAFSLRRGVLNLGCDRYPLPSPKWPQTGRRATDRAEQGPGRAHLVEAVLRAVEGRSVRTSLPEHADQAAEGGLHLGLINLNSCLLCTPFRIRPGFLLPPNNPRGVGPPRTSRALPRASCDSGPTPPCPHRAWHPVGAQSGR